MNRFMELFRCNAATRQRSLVADDFERLRRANYERDDAERSAGTNFWLLARQRFAEHRHRSGAPVVPGAAPAEHERRG